jgi:hypothetical protein
MFTGKCPISVSINPFPLFFRITPAVLLPLPGVLMRMLFLIGGYFCVLRNLRF